MNKKQAIQLLQLIADLYAIVNSPDEPPSPARNGQGVVAETAEVSAN